MVSWCLSAALYDHSQTYKLMIEHKAQKLRYDVIEANFYSGTLADAYGMDVLDLHFQFRFSLQHRMKDGIHWNAVAHRKITSLVLQHAAEAWGVILPCPVTAYEHAEVTEQQPANDSAPKRKGFGYRPPHQFEPYKEYNHQHVMRSRHSRRHYTPYTQHRPFHSGRNDHYY